MEALAHILGDELGLKEAGFPVGDEYKTAISRVQELLGSGASDTTTVNY